jgi:multicomponent Na+:H+ antiporter subunit C
MTLMLAVVVGVLYATAFYMMLGRSIVRLIMGLILLSHASNLLIFVCGGLKKGSVPIIPEGGAVSLSSIPDPLPQALVLTAIVISFGVLAFSLVLAYRSYQVIGTDDSDAMKATEK